MVRICIGIYNVMWVLMVTLVFLGVGREMGYF
jgi:hypothetical protein